jgi:hypothetical protein
MAITSTTIRSTYTGNGNTTAFATGFYFLANAHVKVYVEDVLKTLGTDYSLTGAGNPLGGTVTFNTAPASGHKILILRDTPLTQEVDYVANDAFPAETHEQALDKLTMLAQEMRSSGGPLDRALRYPVTEPSPYVAELPAKADRSNKLLGFNANGQPVATSSTGVLPGSIGTTELADFSVVTNKLADFSVVTNKLANAAVTSAKIANGSVTQNKLDSSLLSYLLDRVNHTGSQLAATISDFASAALAAVTWNTLTGKPSTFPPSSHTHPTSDLTQSGAATGNVLQWNGTAWVPAVPSSSSLDFVVLKDVKASGTNGQTLSQNTWNTRHINTEETDTGNICTLNNNQFTLPAGTYSIQAAFTSALNTSSTSTRQSLFRLRNITNSSDVLFGLTHYFVSSSSNNIMSSLSGVFTLNASTTFEIQEYPKATLGSALSGLPASVSGFSECYLTAVITKIA